jgi:hypothetical protein
MILFANAIARESTMEKRVHIRRIARVPPLFSQLKNLETALMGDIKL